MGPGAWGWMAPVGVVATNLGGSLGEKLAKKAPRWKDEVGEPGAGGRRGATADALV